MVHQPVAFWSHAVHRDVTFGISLAAALLGACSGSSDAGEAPDDPLAAEVESSGFALFRSEMQRQDPALDAGQRATFAADRRALGVELYQELGRLPENQGRSFVYSPHSVSTALAMAYAGARGTTQLEMQDALHFGSGDALLHGGFNHLSRDLSGREIAATDETSGLVFVENDDVWAHVDVGKRPTQAYVDGLAANYDPGINLVDFEQPESARAAINREVERATRGQIGELLPAGSIVPGLTTLVLTNSIYLKAAWAQTFDAARTQTAPFFSTDGSSSELPMMRMVGSFDYLETDAIQAIRLAYVGRDMALTLLLPRQGQFAEVETSLSEQVLGEWLAALTPRSVELAVPKLNVRSRLGMQLPLKALGMSSAFDPMLADFSGIGPHQAFISDVFHEAFIGLDEAGTEAGAATAVVFSDESDGPEPDVEFNADRPFIMIVEDLPTATLLFVGRYLGD